MPAAAGLALWRPGGSSPRRCPRTGSRSRRESRCRRPAGRPRRGTSARRRLRRPGPGPSRASAQRMSSLACDGCIEAITPSSANRRTSSLRTTWACSIRSRGSRASGTACARRGIGVEHQGVALVADGVRADLPAVPQRGRRRRLEHLGIDQEQPGVAGIVVVGLEQAGPARAHGAVDEELDRPQLEPRRRAPATAAAGSRRRPRPRRAATPCRRRGPRACPSRSSSR